MSLTKERSGIPKIWFSSTYNVRIESTILNSNGNTTSTVSNVSCSMVHGGDTKAFVHKLCYTGQKCYKIPEVLIKMYGPKVSSLDLSYNELRSLKGLEGFPSLRELVLDNNQLSDSLVFPPLEHLHTLSLNKNKINDIELLLEKILKNIPNLTYLSLLGNKACPNQLSDLDKDEDDYKGYRYYVLYRLPRLQFLDSTRVSENERLEAQVKGQYTKIARPRSSESQELSGSPILFALTPLPRSIRRPEDHRGAFGKCTYHYSGKQSEGNRFILNSDL